MIVIDVEIKKAILGRNETPVEGIEYCAGWKDYAGMGIAVVCTYDPDSHLSRVFLEKHLDGLRENIAEHGGETGGFNTRKFDIPLLAAHGVEVPSDERHYDILEKISSACGTFNGWNLDAIVQGTFGLTKAGDSAKVPHLWQQGERGRVVDHCLKDVWLEAMLLKHIQRGRAIKAAGKSPLTIPNPYAKGAP